MILNTALVDEFGNEEPLYGGVRSVTSTFYQPVVDSPPQATAPVAIYPIQEPERFAVPRSPTDVTPSIPVSAPVIEPVDISVSSPADTPVSSPVITVPTSPTDVTPSIPVDFPILYEANSIQFPIKITIAAIPNSSALQFPVNVTVEPAIPVFAPYQKQFASTLRLIPIPLNLFGAVMTVARNLLSGKVEGFFDEDREGKTVLNFGQDYQALLTNWMFDPSDSTGTSMLVKMYRPLPDAVEEKMQVWISRELSAPIIDRLFVTFTPAAAPKVYLRAPNKNIKLIGQDGTGVANVTMGSLLSANAFDPVKATDPVLEEWFTHDVNASELNVNYADYREFVFFGSAQARINAFVNKLTTIEDFDALIAKQSSSLALAGQIITGSLPYPAIQKYSEQRMDVIRSFDPYERFLYYSTETPYSASLSTDDAGDAYYINTDATWPKISGSVASVTSSVAQTWLTTQLNIATAYDIQNVNALVNNLPAYLKSDNNSQEFITFVNLVGHHFDILKVYTDNMSNIYDRDSDPTKGMSQDLVWNIANSFGIQLPNQYSVRKLVDYTIGELQVASPKVYREAAAETWKRFLHNQIYLMKTKGTKTSLRALANTYGVLPNVLQIKESTTVGPDSTPNFETYEEQTNALNFSSTASAFVKLPWNSLPSLPKTLEVRFATTLPSASLLASADNAWAISLVPTAGNYGKVVVRTTNSTIISSSVLPIYSGEFYNTMLRYEPDGVTLHVARSDGDDIVERSVSKETGSVVTSIFTAQQFVNIGGSGSLFTDTIGFNGLVDEVRVWGETISDDTFTTHTKYAGLYNGNTSTSARDSLFVRLSFNKTVNLGISSSLENETPYLTTYPTPSLNTVSAYGFPNIPSAPNNMAIITREVTRFTPNAGSNFTTNKVIIAPPAENQYTNINGTLVPTLTRDFSMKSVEDKQASGQSTNTVGFYFSITDSINDSIVRSIGNIDLQNLIGDPSDLTKLNYSALQQLNDLYWSSYAYSYNINSFVDFVQELLDPLFTQARSLVPVRVKLLSGIVHEPHILERAKIVQKPVEISDDLTFEAVPVTSQPDVVSADYEAQTATLAVVDASNTLADSLSYDTTVDDNSTFVFESDYFDASSLITGSHADVIAYQPQWDGIVQDLASAAISAVSVVYGAETFGGATVSIKNLMQSASLASPPGPIDASINAITPYTNFDKLESYTYFNVPSGLVATTATVNVRSNANILNNRGTWAKSTTYTRNDFVVQLDLSPEAESGYGKEFVCNTYQGSFNSLVPPSLDPNNWKPMTYVPTETVVLKSAVVINGEVSLAPSGSALPLAIGYMPQHYKFTRDRRRGIQNHQFLGCVQTDTTTSDGLPAVEVSTTAGDTLLVNDGSAPIQPKNNPSGPILDVL